MAATMLWFREICDRALSKMHAFEQRAVHKFYYHTISSLHQSNALLRLKPAEKRAGPFWGPCRKRYSFSCLWGQQSFLHGNLCTTIWSTLETHRPAAVSLGRMRRARPLSEDVVPLIEPSDALIASRAY